MSLENFTEAYFESALWTEEESLPDYFTLCHLFVEDREAMEADCKAFYDTYNHLWNDDTFAGHDFWLSRNGHGAGFFDNKKDNYNTDAKFLQRKAREFGEDNRLVNYFKE